MSLGDLILGRDQRQRELVRLTLLALAVYLVSAAVQHGEVLLGFIDERESWALTAFYLCGSLGFYLLTRTGLNRRIAADRSLTIAQQAFACLVISLSYAITGPARGAIMCLLILVLVYGLFALTTTQARGLALAAGVMLGAVMLWKSQTDPVRYPPAVESLHFVFAVMVLSAVSVLAARLGRLRARLAEQNQSLQIALARIEALALRDELTGLFNRRHMLAQLEQERVRCTRTGQSFCVALLDIDFFKRVNDEHGHPAGDEVLRAFAKVCQDTLRDADVIARWGGEEFLVLMPGSLAAYASKGIDRVRVRLAESDIDCGGKTLRITVSAGLAEFRPHESVSQMLDRADQALYRAKANGRNRTELAV